MTLADVARWIAQYPSVIVRSHVDASGFFTVEIDGPAFGASGASCDLAEAFERATSRYASRYAKCDEYTAANTLVWGDA